MIKHGVRPRLWVALAATALVASGCQGATTPQSSGPQGGETNSTDPAKAEGGPVSGGTLRVALGQYPPDFDINQTITYATQFPGALAYNLLVRHNPDNYEEVIGDLAESWEWQDDTTVTFKLHPGVKFHSGADFTSADVKYTFERIMDPPAGIVSPRTSTLANVASIETPDDLTVVVNLTRPQPDFLDLVATPFNVIYSEETARPLDEAGEGMRLKIDGTGPFKLQEAVEGEVVSFVKNENYFKDGLPYLDGVEFYPVPAGEQTRAALQAGQVDATWFIPSPGDTAALNEMPNLTADFRSFPIFVNLIINMDVPALQDVRVREALSLAIDRQGFVDTVGPLAGAHLPARGLMPPGSPYVLPDEDFAAIPGYDTSPGLDGDIEANRARAKELLAEAGAQDLTLRMITRSEVPAFRDSATYIAEQLGRVGITVEVESLDTGAFVAASADKAFDIYPHSIALDGTVPDSILGAAYTSEGGRNYGDWVDEEIDQAYLAQSEATDPEARMQLIHDFQTKFLGKFYHIQMAFVGYGYAINDAVKGWEAEGQPTLYTNMSMEDVWLEQ